MSTWTWGQNIQYYRDKYDKDKVILLRPSNYSFVESTREEMMACLDEIEKSVLLGEKLSPLQRLALELVMPEELDSLRKSRSHSDNGSTRSW